MNLLSYHKSLQQLMSLKKISVLKYYTNVSSSLGIKSLCISHFSKIKEQQHSFSGLSQIQATFPSIHTNDTDFYAGLPMDHLFRHSHLILLVINITIVIYPCLLSYILLN